MKKEKIASLQQAISQYGEYVGRKISYYEKGTGTIVSFDGVYFGVIFEDDSKESMFTVDNLLSNDRVLFIDSEDTTVGKIKLKNAPKGKLNYYNVNDQFLQDLNRTLQTISNLIETKNDIDGLKRLKRKFHIHNEDESFRAIYDEKLLEMNNNKTIAEDTAKLFFYRWTESSIDEDIFLHIKEHPDEIWLKAGAMTGNSSKNLTNKSQKKFAIWVNHLEWLLFRIDYRGKKIPNSYIELIIAVSEVLLESKAFYAEDHQLHKKDVD